MTNLLLTTLVPFVTMLVGRFPSFAPTVWLYSGVIILLAMPALRMVTLAMIEPEFPRRRDIGHGPAVLAPRAIATCSE